MPWSNKPNKGHKHEHAKAARLENIQKQLARQPELIANMKKSMKAQSQEKKNKLNPKPF